MLIPVDEDGYKGISLGIQKFLTPLICAGTAGAISIALTLSSNPRKVQVLAVSPQRVEAISYDFFSTVGTILAIASGSYSLAKLYEAQKLAEQYEMEEDAAEAIRQTRIEESLQHLAQASETKLEEEALERGHLQAQKKMQMQLDQLNQTAPVISELMSVAGSGAALQMALGMAQKGSDLGDIFLATAELTSAQEQAQLHLELNRQYLTQNQPRNNEPITVPAQAIAPHQLPAQSSKIEPIKRAAASANLQTECLRVDKAPSYERLIFSMKVEDVKTKKAFKEAAELALGKKDLPLYIYGEEQIAIEVALPPEERTYYDFPQRQWVQGERKIILGQSIDGEVVIDLASEDTPQILCVGTTGSGKSNLFRAIAYCLLSQGARVDVCGGKVSDYEDFADRFPSITMNDMGKTFEYVGEYFEECDRRNSMSKAELAAQPAWLLLIDEYKGTVPLDDKLKKTYDQQLSEVTRRGRGLKIHVGIGLQRGSKRSGNDPQGLPPDLRDNLPCRIAFRCADTVGGRMVLSRRGEIVTSLQGRGDGIVQSGLIDQRFQAYRFEEIPE